MAEILTLQPALTREGARRLAASLITMFDAGIDAGPRGVQIRGLGVSLEASVQDLRNALIRLGVLVEGDQLTEGLERLARAARTYGTEEPVGEELS